MSRWGLWAVLVLVWVCGVAEARAESLTIEPIGCYHTGIFGEGAAEIVSYHPATHRVFSVNGKERTIDIVSLQDPAKPERIGQVKLTDEGGLPTSVSLRDDLGATCLLGVTPSDRGRVVFFTPSGEIVGSVEVGWHPDMLTFTPDGRHLVVANEGEPSADGEHDGEGSVSVITVPRYQGGTLAGIRVRNADFRAWDQQPLPAGVRKVERQKPASQDFEPEGIAISADSRKAYVTLQENDAVAVVDIASSSVERLLGLGYKDHNASGNELDTVGLGHADQIRCCPALGMYQPDNVGWFQAADGEYLVLANEGDARGNAHFQEEIALRDARLDPGKFPNAAELQAADRFGSLVVSLTGDTDGDGDLDELYTFGGRSIAIVRTDGQWVYDSGCQIEHLVAERIGRHLTEDAADRPTYRTKKGPEPEGLTLGRIGGHTYVFVGLERDNGIVVFDITDPHMPLLAGYTNPGEYRQHPAGIAGDIGPEGLHFVRADESPTGEPLLVVANEVSGTITIYAIRPAEPGRNIAVGG